MIKVNFAKLDFETRRLIKTIGRAAQARHADAYLVGGFVRDLLLGRKNLDIDIVIENDALALAKDLSKKWKADVRFYPFFLTATLILKNGRRIDLTTARKERYVHSGALPKVMTGTIEDDLFRRDFTINAMAAGINSRAFGVLVDNFGGYNDLKEKRIRILHNQSFWDDPTRMLRAVRFEQRFGFTMEPQTFRLLKQATKQKAFKKVTSPRYFEEFKKILREQNPLPGLRRLNALKGFSFLSQDCHFSKKNFDFFKKVKKVVCDFEQQADFKKDFDTWLVYFMALILIKKNINVPMLAKRFHLTKQETKKLKDLRRLGAAKNALLKKGSKPSRDYHILRSLSLEAIIVLKADASLAPVSRKISGYLSSQENNRLKITGSDLVALGVKEGKLVGQILEKVLDEKINQKLRTHAQELAAAKKILQTKGIFYEQN